MTVSVGAERHARRFSLSGKVALVTGASRGIGAAIATAMADAGAAVALLARDEVALQGVAAEIEGRGGRALVVPGDVTGDAQPLAARVLDELGRVDVLVNNAGTGLRVPLLDLRPSGWQRVLATNLDAAYAMCRVVGAGMVERGSGSVLNVSSMYGLRGADGATAYSAAKHGLVGLTRSLAREWGPAGVRVNALCPGWVRTEMSRPRWSEPARAREVVEGQPLERWAEPDEIAAAAVWLAGDAASYVTGTALVVDGGNLA